MTADQQLIVIRVSGFSYARAMDLWELLPVAWQSELEAHKLDLKRIGNFLDQQLRNGRQFNPQPEQIFAALPKSPNAVKVIILGQDPYPNPAHATGLAFAVPSGTKPLPPSLRNILTELGDDSGIDEISTDLLAWRDQGVLLLNSILTTESGKSLAHLHLGWQPITGAIIQSVTRVNPKVIGVLWGNQAQQQVAEFNPQFIVIGPHPSPLSAYRGFFGSKPFSRINELLRASSQEAINWSHAAKVKVTD
ncbi:MAG: uracil-DNA glycosylase [Actinomycetales bacterium]|nr:uracil-DNA glycosylase [Actinomycetales bacterium]